MKFLRIFSGHKVLFSLILVLQMSHNITSGIIKRRELSRFEEKARYLKESLEDMADFDISEDSPSKQLTRERRLTLSSGKEKMSSAINSILHGKPTTNRNEHLTHRSGKLATGSKNSLSRSRNSAVRYKGERSRLTSTSQTQVLPTTIKPKDQSEDTDSFEIISLENNPPSNISNNSEIRIKMQDFQKDKEELSTKTLAMHTKLVNSYNKNLDEHGTFDKDQKMCWLFHQSLSILPGYSPVDTSFLSLFKSNAGKMPKSFRSLVLQIIIQYTILTEPDNTEHPNLELVAKLRRLKKEYFKTIIQKNPKSYRMQKDERLDFITRLETLKKDQLKNQNELFNHFNDRKLLEKKLDILVDAIQEETDDIEDDQYTVSVESATQLNYYENLVAQKKKIQEHRNQLKEIDSLVKLESLDVELIKQADGLGKYLYIKKYLIMISKSERMIRLLEGLDRRFYERVKEKKLSEKKENDKKDILATIIDLQKIIDFQYKKINSTQTKLDSLLSKLEDKVQDKIKGIHDLKTYQSQFQDLTELSETILMKERKAFDFQKKIDDFEELLARKGVSHSDNVDFIIPPSEVNFYETEYFNYLAGVVQINTHLDQSKKIKIQLEQSENTQFMEKNNLSKPDLKKLEKSPTTPFHQDFSISKTMMQKFIDTARVEYESQNIEVVAEKKTKVLEDIFLMSSADKALLRSSKTIALSEAPTIEKLFNYSRRALEMAKDITQSELEVDRLFGEILAEIYRLNPSTKCLSDTKFAFQLFNLSKINAIYDAQEFLKAFLGSLAAKSHQEFLDAKRFMILLSSLYESQSATAELASQIAEIELLEVTEEDLNTVKKDVHSLDEAGQQITDLDTLQKDTLKYSIARFSRNFSIMMDSYKELTDYAKELASQERSFFRRLISRFRNVLFGSIKLYVDNAIETGVTEYLSSLVEKMIDKMLDALFSAVGFLDQIPFLKEWLKKIFSELIMSLVRFLLEKLRLSFEKIFLSIHNFMNGVGQNKAKQTYFDLDWVKKLKENLELTEDDSPSVPRYKPEELETAFFNASQNVKNSYNQLENLALETFQNSGDRLLERKLRQVSNGSRATYVHEFAPSHSVSHFSSTKSFETDVLRKAVDLDNLDLKTQRRLSHVLGLESSHNDVYAEHRNSFLRGCLALV